MSLICIRIRNSFPFEWLCTRTRFETEVCSNNSTMQRAQKHHCTSSSLPLHSLDARALVPVPTQSSSNDSIQESSKVPRRDDCQTDLSSDVASQRTKLDPAKGKIICSLLGFRVLVEVKVRGLLCDAYTNSKVNFIMSPYWANIFSHSLQGGGGVSRKSQNFSVVFRLT